MTAPARTFTPPQAVLDSMERRRLADATSLVQPCGDGVGRGLTCGNRPSTLFPRGWRCTAHRPPAITPDPTRTLAALQARMRQGLAA